MNHSWYIEETHINTNYNSTLLSKPRQHYIHRQFDSSESINKLISQYSEDELIRVTKIKINSYIHGDNNCIIEPNFTSFTNLKHLELIVTLGIIISPMNLPPSLNYLAIETYNTILSTNVIMQEFLNQLAIYTPKLRGLTLCFMDLLRCDTMCVLDRYKNDDIKGDNNRIYGHINIKYKELECYICRNSTFYRQDYDVRYHHNYDEYYKSLRLPSGRSFPNLKYLEYLDLNIGHTDQFRYYNYPGKLLTLFRYAFPYHVVQSVEMINLRTNDYMRVKVSCKYNISDIAKYFSVIPMDVCLLIYDYV